jgi:SAM-dependent methyltransferase
MDLTAYRASKQEAERVTALMRLLPSYGRRALDIGARDGFLSRLLAERFDEVVALDLTKPDIDIPRVQAVAGDAGALAFEDDHFDAVLCAEVLEHIPPASLPAVCSEIARVCASVAVIGVPHRQDLRLGRTTCGACGAVNPPWGHVNTFDEASLRRHFQAMIPTETVLVGRTTDATNWLSASLMNYAGNPFGTYEQEEGCVHCGQPLMGPAPRSVLKRAATRIAHVTNRLQRQFTRSRGNWIHVKFEKPLRAAGQE